MRIFHSTARRPITFELFERRFALEPGAELEVPDEHAWLFHARQLPLAPGPSPLGAAAPKARVERLPPPAPRPRPVVEDDLTDVEAPEPAGEDDAPGDPDDDEVSLEASLAAAASSVQRPPARSRRRAAEG